MCRPLRFLRGNLFNTGTDICRLSSSASANFNFILQNPYNKIVLNFISFTPIHVVLSQRVPQQINHVAAKNLFKKYKNIALPAKAEYSYFSPEFRLKILL